MGSIILCRYVYRIYFGKNGFVDQLLRKSLKLIGINNSKLGACLIVELLIIAIIAGSFGALTSLLLAQSLLPELTTLDTLYESQQ